MTTKSTRRSFLRNAAAVGAAFTLPACAFAETKVRSPLRFGMIGTGHRGRIHITAINSFRDDAKIVGVCGNGHSQ